MVAVPPRNRDGIATVVRLDSDGTEARTIRFQPPGPTRNRAWDWQLAASVAMRISQP